MTLAEIRTQVRQRANMETSQFVTNAELLLYINASYGELYDVLVSRYEDYFIKLDPTTFLPPTYTVASGSSRIALPSDLYKLRGIDVQHSSPNDWFDVPRFNLGERNSRSRSVNRLSRGLTDVSYRIVGAQIQFLPEDQAAGVYRVWYVPRLTKLVADGDDTAGTTLDFEEYIIVDAAMKCLIKEESDVSALMAIKQQLLQRVLVMTANRDAAVNEKVADVRYRVSDSRFD